MNILRDVVGISKVQNVHKILIAVLGVILLQYDIQLLLWLIHNSIFRGLIRVLLAMFAGY